MKKALKENILLALLAVLIVLLFVSWWSAIGAIKQYFNQPRRVEQKECMYNGFDSWNEYEHYKRLHKFHGTLSSYEDENGTQWFERDGERCALWDPKVRTE